MSGVRARSLLDWDQAELRRRQRLFRLGGFSPDQVSAVAAWLRFAQGTVTGAGYSSVPDLLNVGNPAVQGTDDSRPASVTTTTGFPRADFDGTSDFLTWAPASNNNQTAAFGFATWMQLDTVQAATRGIFSAHPNAADRRCEILTTSGNLIIDVNVSQFSARRATVTSAFSAGTDVFVTWEYDTTGSDDSAKCVITLDAVVQTPSFSDGEGTPGAMPSTLVQTASNYIIGARGPSGSANFLDGKMGPNIFLLGSKMSGATQGLLTTAARTALMNFERA